MSSSSSRPGATASQACSGSRSTRSSTGGCGCVVALADSSCGYGCIASLPPEATGFTTIELKTSFLATALDGTLACESKLVHGGRTTQVWDATVTDEDGKTLALFRCTQLLLYPG
jgi:1,4-dihydroxy-2-naphthoyl-CoA hydrolase